MQLTLDPQETATELPKLTLEPQLETKEEVEEVKKDIIPVELNEELLTEEEKIAVNEFALKIDIADTKQIMQYGSAAQQHIAAFSEQTLEDVKTKDLGDIGESLANLTATLRTTQNTEKKGLAKFFQDRKTDIEATMAQYAKAETNVDKIQKKLEEHQEILIRDIARYDQLYELNKEYYKELTLYIIAGQKALENARATKLVELENKAKETNAPEDAQAFNDFAALCERFEKKLHDLELTRIISIQMAPQTRLLQNNDALMLEKIQSSLVNTIPLWKNQMLLAVGIANGQSATKAQSAVTEMTNEMLKKNADILKIATIETAKEAEKSIVDIETLQHTNDQLISTLDEVMQIQEEGKKKRAEAEIELGKIEGELKQKLLELKSDK